MMLVNFDHIITRPYLKFLILSSAYEISMLPIRVINVEIVLISLCTARQRANEFFCFQ